MEYTLNVIPCFQKLGIINSQKTAISFMCSDYGSKQSNLPNERQF